MGSKSFSVWECDVLGKLEFRPCICLLVLSERDRERVDFKFLQATKNSVNHVDVC